MAAETTNRQVPFLTDPTGREHHLENEASTIGRAMENDIVITSKRVSREHAGIERQGRRVVLFDLGSTNGTFLNDERVLAPTALRDGDRVFIGDVELNNMGTDCSQFFGICSVFTINASHGCHNCVPFLYQSMSRKLAKSSACTSDENFI